MIARVKAGRLVLNVPTNLPEGATVHVEIVDGDELDDQQRARLHQALDAGEDEADRGLVVREEELLARLGENR